MRRSLYITGKGLRIKKCCASCGKKKIAKGGESVCMAGQGFVESDDYCEQWVIKGKLLELPKSKCLGRVKRPEYLRWLVEAKSDPSVTEKYKTLEALAAYWESINGDRYLTPQCTVHSIDEL